jgi:pyruvate dehydrogenase E2 component (dihydrolipoamide acetyltransferase)
MSDSYTVTTLTPVRKLIAERMTETKRAIPHFRLVADIEVDALLSLRADLRQRNPHVAPSLNDLLIKACAAALMDVPTVNLQWADEEIRQYRTADISVVTAVEGGLSTPIIRSAESKSIWAIVRELRTLVARAANRALKTHEIFGGSFSVSNLGMYGVDQFDAIINAPQCAILAIGAAKAQMLVAHDSKPRMATVLRATLSCDHRAIDGVTGARFLAALRQHVQQVEHLRPTTED